jgi:hypothetical protein
MRTSFLTIVALLPSLLTACSGDLLIRYATAPDKNCRATDNLDSIVKSGRLDLNHTFFDQQPAYYLNLSLSCTEAVQLKKAAIRYEWVRGREIIASEQNLHALFSLEEGEATFHLSGEIRSDGKYGAAFVPDIRVIGPAVGTQLASAGESYADSLELGIYVTLNATDGGSSIDSNEFYFPVHFCWGCLDTICCDGQDAYYPACRPGQDDNDLAPCQCP